MPLAEGTLSHMHRLTLALTIALTLITACSEKSPDSPAAAGRPINQPSSEGATPPAETTTQANPKPNYLRFGIPEAPPTPDYAIRLATYNTLNLFDDVDDPDLSAKNEDIDDAKPESELIALADTIRRLDADVLALEEVESEDALNAFVTTYISDRGYDHVVSIDAGDPRGIEQAVLSRFPITHYENWPRLDLGGVHPDKYGDQENWYAGQPITFHRSPLRVDIQVPADVTGAAPYDLTLFVVHQKSGQYSDYWRVAEATRLASIVSRILANEPDRNIAILGDFNTMPDQQPMHIFADAGLIDPMADVAPPQSITHESGRRIDYILLSPSLRRDLVDHAFVLSTPARPAGADYRTTPPPPGFASDHYPLAIDIRPVDN